MKKILGYILIAIGIVLPLYLLISGVSQIVYAINPFVPSEIVIGAVKVLFCGLGVIPAYFGVILTY